MHHSCLSHRPLGYGVGPRQSSGSIPAAVFRSQARRHRAFAQGFERRVLFAIDEETAEINRRLKETLDE